VPLLSTWRILSTLSQFFPRGRNSGI
jgi:hypothetical protein